MTDCFLFHGHFLFNKGDSTKLTGTRRAPNLQAASAAARPQQAGPFPGLRSGFWGFEDASFRGAAFFYFKKIRSCLPTGLPRA